MNSGLKSLSNSSPPKALVSRYQLVEAPSVGESGRPIGYVDDALFLDLLCCGDQLVERLRHLGDAGIREMLLVDEHDAEVVGVGNAEQLAVDGEDRGHADILDGVRVDVRR